MSTISSKFYITWRKGACGGGRMKYETKKQAINGAEYLAQTTQDTYFVLEVVGMVVPVPAKLSFTEL